MGTAKRFFTRLELIDMADRLGFELKINSHRMLLLVSKDDPDCWGTVTDLNTGKPAVGFRHYDIAGWERALPANIERIIETAGPPKKLGNGH